MMNKPITHRVKKSPFKQTTPKAKTYTRFTRKGPDQEFVETRNKTYDDLRKEGWSEAKIEEAKAWRAKNPDVPNVGVTETKTKEGEDFTVTITNPLYTQDFGDALTAPEQRGVERGLLQSARKTGKFAAKLARDEKALKKAKAKDSDSVKTAKLEARVEARKNALDAQKAFATTQREMAIQGIRPDSGGRGKISTLKGKDFGREMNRSDMDEASQKEMDAKEAIALAEEMARNNARGNIKMANTISAQQMQPVTFSTPTVEEIRATIQRDINAPRMKSKSPYKMKGYGSKAYKK